MFVCLCASVSPRDCVCSCPRVIDRGGYRRGIGGTGELEAKSVKKNRPSTK